MAVDIIARLQLQGQQFRAQNQALFGDMEKRAADVAARMKTSFDRSFAEISQMSQQALAAPRTAAGALDLGADRYRQAAAAAQNQAQALREIEQAARRAAAASGDTTQETRNYIQAATAAAREAEELARAHTVEANSLDRLQSELNQTASQTVAMNTAQQGVTRDARLNQLAMRNLGFQISDVGASLASGSNLFVIFGQQIGQVGGALSDMTGKLGAVGRFLTNPWVAALTTAAIVVGLFVDKLGDAKEAADLAKIGSDGLSDAQGVLGKMFDLTSGKIEHQNELLRLNARLTAINLRAEAAKAADSSSGVFRRAGDTTVLGNVSAFFSRNPGIDNPFERVGLLGARGREVAGYVKAVQTAKTDADRSTALERALQFSENADFTGLGVEKKEFQQAVIDAASSVVKKSLADKIDQSLDTGKLDPAFRRDGRKPKDNSRAIAARDEFGRDAADRIANIRDRFADTPNQVQVANKALRQLDDIMDDLGRRKPPNFEDTIKSAREAKAVVLESLTRPLDEYIRAQRESIEVGRLVAQGRTVEADALADVYRLQRQMGPLNDQQLAQVRAIAIEHERIARAMEDQRRRLAIYTQAVGDAQRTFETFLLALDKKPGAAFKNLGRDLMANFKNLQVSILSEKLFGGLDRELADFINGTKGPQAAIDVLSTESTRAGDAMGGFADAADEATKRLLGISTGSALPSGRFVDSILPPRDNPDFDADLADIREAMGIATTVVAGAEIVVTGQREATSAQKRAANDNQRAASRMLSAADAFGFINDRLATRLQSLLGDQIPAELSRALSGAAAGYATGGPVGGVIGGLKGALEKKLPDAIGKKFSDALSGAQTGTMVAGIGKSLGLKMSTTGSQIGGAIGGATGIPGGQIIGSIIGGTVGGLFKKHKSGYATIGATDDGTLGIVGTGGNKASYRAAGESAAGDVTSSLAKIVEALGGTYDASRGSVSIGRSGDSWHVDTTGKGRLRKSQGGNDFNDDYEAAVRFAVADLIKDGVVTGISDAASRILRSGQDLDAAIEKAITIESIPKLLRARLDPLGAAIDDLNAKWAKNIAILKEGGATAAQMAEAQQLYNLELADVKANTKSASETLKDFVKSMKIGSDSPLSLRDQEASALAELQPYLNKINAGETIDQDAYRAAAESYLDIERQLYGSTQSFFDKFDMIMAANTKAIEKIDNAVPIRTASDPFAEKTAQATQASANILEQLSTQQQQALDLSIQGNALLKGLLDALKANGGRLYTGLKAA